MKPILKSNASKGFVRTGSVPELSPKPTLDAKAGKPVFSLSSLKITKPRTAEDIQRAIAQGRVAELKPD